MAVRHRVSRTFRRDSLLQEFYLDGVITKGKILGVGSYGSVVEVEFNHVTCAAKQMHELLLDPSNEGVHETVEKYQRECQLMASLRHPNITQFLGLCFLEGSPLPLLVMERLEMSVDDLLECAPNIPLPVKLSILTDTCSGLAYLHGMKTPIVHRDLTARNVLLTSSFTAKIADLGNSRIVSLTPSQLAQTLSKNPGTTMYMAPEALSDSHRYGPSLDVFSFGHLCLYTLIQIFPCEMLAATQADPDNPGHVIGRTEVERRDVYMKKLEGQFSESHPVLVQLVSQCLDNDPLTRPSSEEILGILQEKKKDMEEIHGGHWKKILNVTSILVAKELNIKDKQIKKLQDSEAKLESDVEELLTTNTRLQADKTKAVKERNGVVREKQHVELINNRLENEKSNFVQEISLLQLDKLQLESSLENLQSEKCELESRLKDQQSEKHELESRLEDQQQLATEKQSLEELVKQLKNDLEAIKISQETEPHLQTVSSQSLPKISPSLEWQQGPDMPVAMSGHIQAVEIEGTVYVGGGDSESYHDDHKVMAYTQSKQWHSLPPYSATSFSMTGMGNKLVLVGGHCSEDDGEDGVSRELGVWQTNDRQWTQPFSPMPTARSRASSTCYKHWLVVAGGHNAYVGFLRDRVEILDVPTNQWHIGASMPIPIYDRKSTVINDTWYFMGDCNGLKCEVGSVSLDTIVQPLLPASHAIMKELTPLEKTQSCPLNFRGSLLAVGGRHKDNTPTSDIVQYVPESSTWVPAGELPQALDDCTCVFVSNKLFVFGGNKGYTRVKTMYYCTCTDDTNNLDEGF